MVEPHEVTRDAHRSGQADTKLGTKLSGKDTSRTAIVSLRARGRHRCAGGIAAFVTSVACFRGYARKRIRSTSGCAALYSARADMSLTAIFVARAGGRHVSTVRHAGPEHRHSRDCGEGGNRATARHRKLRRCISSVASFTDADGHGNITAVVAGTTPATLQAILDNSRNYYVNRHTSVNPTGALREQMHNPKKR